MQHLLVAGAGLTGFLMMMMVRMPSVYSACMSMPDSVSLATIRIPIVHTTGSVCCMSRKYMQTLVAVCKD